MRVDFCNENDSVVGQVSLDDHGSLRFEGCAIGIEAGTAVIGPDGLKTPEDGEDYLYALPFTFRNAYMHACLVR